jgi:hypothetical protein
MKFEVFIQKQDSYFLFIRYYTRKEDRIGFIDIYNRVGLICFSKKLNLRIIQLFQYYGLAKNLERQLVNLDIHITSESKKY